MASKEPKQRTMAGRALRFALLPSFGSSLRPARESFHIFVELIATIFIAFKMLPAGYVAELGSRGLRPSLSGIILTAWHNLKFSKESIPQLLIFFALLSSLVFAALALVTLGMALLNAVFIGRAHAAGYYTSNAGDDIAQQWIDFLRDGSTSGDFFSAYAQPLMWASPIQSALISALGFYSDAILIVAAVILFYHLAAMTVETAHEGVVMGKRANQIWAPIRLVVAIGLLVPIGGGLNSGQYIIFKVTEWGSALASNVWSIFLGGFASGEGVASIPQFAADVVYNTVLTEACKAAYESLDNGGGKGTVASNHKDASNPGKPETGNTGGISSNRAGQQTPEPKNSQYCGHNNFNQTAKGGSATGQAVQSSAQSCFDQMQQSAQQAGKQYAKIFTYPDAGGDGNKKTPQYDGQVFNIINDYMQCLAGDLPIPNLLGVFALSSEWGWLSSGAVLSAISQAESDANDLGALIPDTQAPDFGAGGDAVMKHHVAPIVWKVSKFITMIPQGGGGGGGGALGSDACASQRGQLMQQAQGMQQEGNAQGHFLDRVLQVVDWLAAWNCVWISQPDAEGQGNFVLGIAFTGSNPIAEMARLGQACINTAYDAFDLMVNISADLGFKASATNAAASTPSVSGSGKGGFLQLSGEGAKGALQMISTVLGMITTVFFTSGILLAYYVPLIPFINFLFGALAWVMAVLEAVIALPLLAVAHLTVEGQGLPGPSAKQGYFYIFNIALRPVMMVFGLIVGLLVFYAAVSYMNLFYMMAISTSGGLATSHLFLSRLVYNAIYVIILYICANSSFKAINLLPDHAVKWMGHQPYHFANMGEAREVAGPLMQGAGNISQVTGAVQGSGFGGAVALGAGGGVKGGGAGDLMGTIKGQHAGSHGGGQRQLAGGDTGDHKPPGSAGAPTKLADNSDGKSKKPDVPPGGSGGSGTG